MFARATAGWLGVLGLALVLAGCQTPVAKAPPPAAPAPPAAAVKPRPVRPTLYVAANQLSLRPCPGTDCRKISTLKLNDEVEKMGEIHNWTQIRVKRDGAIGYVGSRYLSVHPVEVAQTARKKRKPAKLRQATRPAESVAEQEQAEPQNQEPATPLPRVM